MECFLWPIRLGGRAEDPRSEIAGYLRAAACAGAPSVFSVCSVGTKKRAGCGALRGGGVGGPALHFIRGDGVVVAVGT